MSLQRIEERIDGARDWGVTVLRIVIGVVFVAHGMAKVLGPGLSGVTEMFGAIGIPMPGINAVLAIAAEVLGGLALIVGFKTRWAALPLAFTMIVAFVTVHMKAGFFLTREGTDGFEYVLVLFAASVALFFLGSGRLSIDRALKR